MRKNILSSCFIILAMNLAGQDLHYSQFDAMVVTLNPASAGVHETDYRFSNDYKLQWASVATPFQTYAISFDMPLFKKEGRNHFIGVGGNFVKDIAGKSKLNTTLYNFILSAHQKLNDKNYISVGLQGGYASRKANLANLRWDEQWNGEIYDPGLSSGETNLNNNVKTSYKDFAAGALWHFVPGELVKAKTGISYYHLNRPDKSFNSKEENLYPKLVINSVISFKLPQANKLDRYLQPQVIFMRQGPHQEVYLGSFIKYVIQEPSRYTDYRSQAIVSFGGFYRLSDAAVFATRIDYGPITLGISYDINVSQLRKASALDGGVEFTLIYANFFQTSKIKMEDRLILPQL
ncbi:MAG: PorP/SprF family type IX secretion system membrane protein [Bacteroidetes bacterium]|nr:PorP/SprF family type IX secretion system membrane protein [Bacteroidota bacterium]